MNYSNVYADELREVVPAPTQAEIAAVELAAATVLPSWATWLCPLVPTIYQIRDRIMVEHQVEIDDAGLVQLTFDTIERRKRLRRASS